MTRMTVSPRCKKRLLPQVHGSVDTDVDARSFVRAAALILVLFAALLSHAAIASDHTEAVERHYTMAPPAPASQSQAAMEKSSRGCMTCHTQTDQRTMHENPAINLGCADCHGGNVDIMRPKGSERHDDDYIASMQKAHVLPRYPEEWNYPGGSALPKRTYTLLNRESREFVRFQNPSDYRVAKLACGACHLKVIENNEHSLMATNAMFFGGASYNNGILDEKLPFIGEAYTNDGEPATLISPVPVTAEMRAKNILDKLIPLPAWETVKPADIFRVFERGGRNKSSQFPEIANPSADGSIQLLERPGQPDIRQSNRGLGTGSRVATPILNITKTRLNDPFTWFAGTADNPGDFRNSGCASCHVVYANDRDPDHSGHWAKFGNMGESNTVDPTIPHDEPGHPIYHKFTNSIPTSQCMGCHMHQPNMFLNTFMGYTMWTYVADAPTMWPEKQKYPTAEEIRKVNDRNPAGAAVRGKWADLDFLKDVSKLNPELQDTQFADYHGHGWIFRAIFKRDLKGDLLTEDDKVIPPDDPDKFNKAVHLTSIHMQKGMHCVDCHFAKDNHGNGYLYGAVAPAVTISCEDCHGTADSNPNLHTSGPAALGSGTDMSLFRTPFGKLQFEWIGDTLIQRSVMDPELEWEVRLVKDTVTPGNPVYNPKAARAKLMSEDTDTQRWGLDVAPEDRAHSFEKMECYACHTSWTTACGGCHLPIETNWKTPRNHYEGGETRNFATYNPQVARAGMFMLGRRGEAAGGKYAPIRSSSALIFSSQDSKRNNIYVQQPPISSAGFSSQAFNPHFPHTVRTKETKTCSDCHLSEKQNNNATMAQLMGYGTHFINFAGYHAYVGGAGKMFAVRVTDWTEPQAVIGSYLQRYAYPDYFQAHLDKGKALTTAFSHSAGRVGCLQQRGEYLYMASGKEGLQVFDIANIANKDFSQRIITAPFSPLGDDTHVKTKNATCLSLVTTQPVDPSRNQGHLMRVVNKEQPIHPIYNFAVITDSEEGLILVNIDTLADREPRNNFLSRALTWNENGVLDGARHVEMGGSYAYIAADKGLVILNLHDPMHPKLASIVPLNGVTASALQFRYLFVLDAKGLQVIDVTDPEHPELVSGNSIPLDKAYNLYLARTYAYVAAGDDGLVIVDIRKPEDMHVYQRFDAGGRITDARDVIVASTYTQLFAYIADGVGGLKVIELTSPASQPRLFGYSPEPKPELIAHYDTDEPVLSLSEPLERDRAVDETGGQVAVFGRLGSRPLSLEEMRRFYLNEQGDPWYVSDDVNDPASPCHDPAQGQASTGGDGCGSEESHDKQ